VPKTPYTTRQLEKQVSTTRKLLRGYISSSLPIVEARLNKIIKSYKLALNKFLFTKEEIRKYRANNK
jgi:hypothetical protein